MEGLGALTFGDIYYMNKELKEVENQMKFRNIREHEIVILVLRNKFS